MRPLESLAEQELVTLTASDLRDRYVRGEKASDGHVVDIDALTESLFARFALHERREIERIRAVLELVQFDGCQTNHLVAHFGEIRDAPCGHCSWCHAKKPTVLPPPSPTPDFDALIDDEAKLSKHEQNGALDEHRFDDVLAWREGLVVKAGEAPPAC